MADEKSDRDKKDKSGEDAPALISLHRKRSEDFRVYYSNDTQVSPTRWDVQFIFGQTITPAASQNLPDTIISDQQVGIVMSIEHAKAFFNLFERQMKNLTARQVDFEPHDDEEE